MKLKVNNLEETINIGKEIGRLCRGGDIFCLIGEVGAGKTHLTKGIALGLGIDDNITSPTFTIVNEYDSGRLKLNHFDVYRVNDPDEIYAIGFDEYIFSEGVSIIEWADYIEDLIPEEACYIHIKKLQDQAETYREITISYKDDRYTYLKELELWRYYP